MHIIKLKYLRTGGHELNILMTGGTGFVGGNLIQSFRKENHHTYILTRSPEKHPNTKYATYISYNNPVKQLPIIHAVINLAGESLFGYWSNRKKRAILNSRMETTNQVIDMIKQLERKPEVFISGSAIGYYGASEDIMFSEETTLPGNDFLADVVVQWETCAKQAEELGIRTVYTRFGVILGSKGALPYMSLPVKMFAGGKIGNGQQWVSWVHIEDVVRLLTFCLTNTQINGPVNVTAPYPKRNKDLMKALAKVLKRPYWFPVPSPFVHAAIGEMSQLITKGQYVLPKKALDNRFEFSYPFLMGAIRAINTKEN
jgi:uncharacterized protein (TIGR01777 family)